MPLNFFISLLLQICFAQVNFSQTNVNVNPVTKPQATPIVENVEKAKNVVTEKNVNLDHLRKREHRLSWNYQSSNVKVDVETLPKAESDQGLLNIDYGYNWGRFEIGAGYGFSLSDNGASKLTTGLLTVYGRLNILENKPENNFIPYLALGVQSYLEELNSTADLDTKGNGWAFQVGFSWFPLGEIYAVEVALFASNIKGDVKSGTTTLDATIQRTGLAVGYSIFF